MSYKLVHQYDPNTTEGLAAAYRNILGLIGEDPDREGLLKTPERVAKAMQFLTQGSDIDPVAILQSARFEEQVAEMVVVKDIEMYSMCEHHMIPFFGKAHVAYIPNGYITGLSKVARVVEAKHLCMMMRGVEKQNSVTTTSAFDGAFQHEVTRSEFLRLISSKLS